MRPTCLLLLLLLLKLICHLLLHTASRRSCSQFHSICPWGSYVPSCAWQPVCSRS
jgi:hypothetical protein